MAKKKISSEDEIYGIYGFVLDNARRTAKNIEKTINNSKLDSGGIIIVHGPMKSGKSLMICELLERIEEGKSEIKDRKMVVTGPRVEREDVMLGYIFSRGGKKYKINNFENRQDIEKLFNENDVVLMDDFQFIPYEMQSFFLKELELFIERGGWFVGVGLLYNSQGGEFLISSLLLEKAYREYNLCSLCQMCGAKAYKYNQRLIDGKVGDIGQPELLPPSAKISYEPRCKNCHMVKK